MSDENWDQASSGKMKDKSPMFEEDLMDPQEAVDEPTSSSAADRGSQVHFHCTVGEPQKEQEGSQNSYISYLVSTETNSPSFPVPEVKVRRRFSDFVYLYETLVNLFPACAVPPLPETSRLEYIKGDRFNDDFTLKRASSLARFLTRITNHPALKRSRVLYTFLESDDWNTFKKNKGGSRASTGAPGSALVGSISEGAASTASAVVGVVTSSVGSEGSGAGVLEGISDTFLNAFSKVNNQSKELIEVKEHADKLEDNLGNIEKTFTHVVRRQGDLAHDLEEFSSQTLKLSSLEPGLSLEFSELAKAIQGYSSGVSALRQQIDSDYIVSLRDLENYIGSLKALIRMRDQKQLDYEALTDYLNKAEADKATLLSGGGVNFLRNKVEDLRGVNHDVARKQRLNKLDVKITDLKREVTEAQETSVRFEEFTLNEVAIFERIKTLEMKDTLTGLVDSHVEFYQNMIRDWESIYKTVSGVSR